MYTYLECVKITLISMRHNRRNIQIRRQKTRFIYQNHMKSDITNVKKSVAYPHIDFPTAMDRFKNAVASEDLKRP
jgi:hypothetical protein